MQDISLVSTSLDPICNNVKLEAANPEIDTNVNRKIAGLGLDRDKCEIYL
jgi:hypothetical protein